MKKVYTVLFFTFAIFAASCSRSTNSNANTTTAAAETIDVQTAAVKIEQIPSYFEATGTLAGDAQADVAPTIAGKIERVNFDVGSYVNKGDALVTLDPRDAQIRLETAQAQVEQQRRAVTQAEANAAQALANLRQTQARLGVKDGEGFAIENFSQVKSVSAQLAFAEKELARFEKLLSTGDVSKSAYDQRKATRDQLLGQIDEARSNAAISIKAIDTARSAYDAAKSGIASARSAVATGETQIAQAKKTLSDNTIYAPMSGFISERTADPGEYLSPNAPNTKICTIVRTAILRLKIDVPEQNVGKIAQGQGISMQTSAYPDRSFAGTVTRILPSLNATSRTLTVEAEVQNNGGLLKPGQFAIVRITQPKPENAALVPASAVRADGDINKVFVVKDGRVEERVVTTGLLENDRIQIKTGVQEGEVVATGGVEKLHDGVLVRQMN